MTPAAPLRADDSFAELLRAQLAGDQRAALAVVHRELDAGVAVRELHELVRATQLEIGRLWQENQISVAHEHVATAIAQLALSAIFARAPLAARRRATIVVACVEGERHDLPARLVADALALEGYDVTFLGADVPLDHLCRLIVERRPRAIALSVTMTHHLGALRLTVARLRELDRGVPILVGGHAIEWSPGVLAELGLASTGVSPTEVVEVVRRAAGAV